MTQAEIGPAPPAAPGLKGRVLRAGKWTLGAALVTMILRLATNIVLARLLFPDVFGLMSVVNMLLTALMLFSDIGVTRAVVQTRRGDDPALLDTAWTVQVIRGLGLAAACLLAAAGVALGAHLHMFRAGTAYADSRLPLLIVVFAVTPVIQGLSAITVSLSRRTMSMHLLSKIELSGQLASAVAMIVVASVTPTVWTLMVGAIVATVVRVGLGYRLLPGYQAKLRIDREALDEILDNGKWIFLSSIIFFLASNTDRVLLGGLISSREFGLYSIALLMANVLQGLATKMCISIVYPALAEVHRERPGDLGKTIAKFQWAYDGLVSLLSALLITAGPALIAVLYDHRYRDAGWMLSILAVGTIGVRYQVVEECYQVFNRAQYATLANFVRLLALIGGVFLGDRLAGLKGVIVAVALCQYAAWPIAIWFKLRYKAFAWRAEALLVPAVLGGMAAGWLLSLLIHWALPHRFA